MSKFEEFLRTPNVGHLAVVLIRGDCVYLNDLSFYKGPRTLRVLGPLQKPLLPLIFESNISLFVTGVSASCSTASGTIVKNRLCGAIDILNIQTDQTVTMNAVCGK